MTATPIGLGVLVGGRLSETWGRRKTAALGIVAGVVGTTLSFVFSGPAMWAAKLGGNVIGAVGVPAMAVYGPELFGTHDRGRANALIVTAGVVGSAIGLVSVGWLSDRWDAIARDRAARYRAAPRRPARAHEVPGDGGRRTRGAESGRR